MIAINVSVTIYQLPFHQFFKFGKNYNEHMKKAHDLKIPAFLSEYNNSVSDILKQTICEVHICHSILSASLHSKELLY